jgi:hypothetical protein
MTEDFSDRPKWDVIHSTDLRMNDVFLDATSTFPSRWNDSIFSEIWPSVHRSRAV